MHFVAQKSLPIDISHGEGCELVDTKGQRYLDFVSGWCVSAIGWGHPEIRKAIAEETHSSFSILNSYASPP